MNDMVKLDVGRNARALSEPEALERLRGMYGEGAERKLAELKERNEALSKHISPPGALNLPEALDQKRLAYGIPDECFRRTADFDRVFVWQLPEGDGEHVSEGSNIIIPDAVKVYERESAPQGILLRAGMQARDVMKAHGYRLGDTVILNRLSPMRFVCAKILGKEIEVLIVRLGDLAGNLDLQERLDAREMTVAENEYTDKETGLTYTQHAIRSEGKNWGQVDPWIADDT